MKSLARLRARIARSVGRFRLTLLDDSGAVQRLQGEVLDGEVIDRVERVLEYGFTSRPKPDAEGVLIAVAGSRGQGVVIGLGDRRYRLQLEEGEVALHDDLEQVVHLTRDGIRITTSLSMDLTAGTDLKLSGERIILESDQVLLGGEDGLKAIARHDDAVVSGKVVASSTKVKAK